MGKRLDVGKSWRTHAKHELMRSISGQEVGAASKLDAIDRLVFFDLTAGDGVVDDLAWERACSPGILARCAATSPKPVLILLYEIQANTYDRLLDSLSGDTLRLMGYVRDGEECWRLGDKVTIRTINASGQSARVDFLTRRDAVLAFNDPNVITEWAMRNSFAQDVGDRAWCCRILSTMGCNPAGLKRLKLEERLDWFGLVDDQQDACPGYRDLLLAAIERDDAQWAYLLSTAGVWRDTTEKVVKTAFKKVGRTAAMQWWRTNEAEFEATKLRLFLTRPELALLRGDEQAWLSLTSEKRLLALIERGAR